MLGFSPLATRPLGALPAENVIALTATGIATGAPTVGTPSLSVGGATEEPASRPPQTGGAILGTAIRRRAGSGRWVRVDQDLVELTAAKASGHGCTSEAQLPAILWAEEARAEGCTSSASVSAGAAVPGARATARGSTAAAALQRDDTFEIARMIALLPKAKRIAVTPPADVASLYDLIDRMKKKAA